MSLLRGMVARSVQFSKSFKKSVAMLILSLLPLIVTCAFFISAGLLLSLIAFFSSSFNTGFQSLFSPSLLNAVVNIASASLSSFNVRHAFCSLISNIWRVLNHVCHFCSFSLSNKLFLRSRRASCKNWGCLSNVNNCSFNAFISFSNASPSFNMLGFISPLILLNNLSYLAISNSSGVAGFGFSSSGLGSGVGGRLLSGVGGGVGNPPSSGLGLITGSGL